MLVWSLYDNCVSSNDYCMLSLYLYDVIGPGHEDVNMSDRCGKLNCFKNVAVIKNKKIILMSYYILSNTISATHIITLVRLFSTHALIPTLQPSLPGPPVRAGPC